jgi:tetratricopeptide (TPR) repeat protein
MAHAGLGPGAGEKYDEAIVCFDKALQLDKNNPKILFNKGNALMCQCKYKESLECFDEALKIRTVK